MAKYHRNADGSRYITATHAHETYVRMQIEEREKAERAATRGSRAAATRKANQEFIANLQAPTTIAEMDALVEKMSTGSATVAQAIGELFLSLRNEENFLVVEDEQYYIDDMGSTAFSMKVQEPVIEEQAEPVEIEGLEVENEQEMEIGVEIEVQEATDINAVAYEQAKEALSILTAKSNMGHDVEVPSLADMVEVKKAELVESDIPAGYAIKEEKGEFLPMYTNADGQLVNFGMKDWHERIINASYATRDEAMARILDNAQIGQMVAKSEQVEVHESSALGDFENDFFQPHPFAVACYHVSRVADHLYRQEQEARWEEQAKVPQFTKYVDYQQVACAPAEADNLKLVKIRFIKVEGAWVSENVPEMHLAYRKAEEIQSLGFACEVVSNKKRGFEKSWREYRISIQCSAFEVQVATPEPTERVLHFTCGHTEVLRHEETPENIQKIEAGICLACTKADPEKWDALQKSFNEYIQRRYPVPILTRQDRIPAIEVEIAKVESRKYELAIEQDKLQEALSLFSERLQDALAHPEPDDYAGIAAWNYAHNNCNCPAYGAMECMSVQEGVDEDVADARYGACDCTCHAQATQSVTIPIGDEYCWMHKPGGMVLPPVLLHPSACPHCCHASSSARGALVCRDASRTVCE